MTDDELCSFVRSAEFYGLLCDVIERAWKRWPVDTFDDGMRHTSTYAREAANRVIDALESGEVS